MNYFLKNPNNSYLAPTEGKILLSRLVPKDEMKQKIGIMAGTISAENA